MLRWHACACSHADGPRREQANGPRPRRMRWSANRTAARLVVARRFVANIVTYASCSAAIFPWPQNRRPEMSQRWRWRSATLAIPRCAGCAFLPRASNGFSRGRNVLQNPPGWSFLSVSFHVNVLCAVEYGHGDGQAGGCSAHGTRMLRQCRVRCPVTRGNWRPSQKTSMALS